MKTTKTLSTKHKAKALNKHNVSGSTGFNKCCAKEIQRLWKIWGGSMNIVRYENTCPKCNHYIGLTQTKKNEAVDFLKKYSLKYYE